MPSYAKAPITEALIEIQIKETGESSIDVIGDELSKQLATDYPHRYPLKEGTIEAQFGPEGELRSATNEDLQQLYRGIQLAADRLNKR